VRRLLTILSLLSVFLSAAGLLSFSVPPSPYILALQAAYPTCVALSALATLVAFSLQSSRLRPLTLSLLLVWGGVLVDVHATSRPLPPPAVGSSAEGGLRLVAANLMLSNEYAPAATESLLTARPDVLITVETPDAVAAVLARHGFNKVSSGARSAYTTTIWSTLPARRLPSISLNDRDLPVAEVRLASGSITVVGVHLMSPTTVGTLHRWEGNWDVLTPALHRLDGSVVVAGDFNSSKFHRPMRTLSTSYDNASSYSLTTAFSPTWPAQPYRWWRYSLQLLDLDHVLVKDLPVVDFSRFSIPGSDHLGVVATLHPTIQNT